MKNTSRKHFALSLALISFRHFSRALSPLNDHSRNSLVNAVTIPSLPTTNFFVREARETDLGKISKLVTDGFYKENTNFFTYPVERLTQYLGLSSTFQTYLHAERSGARHRMLVVCRDEEPIAYLEVDDHLQKGEVNSAPRPYMYNLVVQEDFRRMGVASLLVRHCETIVRSEWCGEILYCRTKDTNRAANEVYGRSGYLFQSSHVRSDNGDTNLLLKKSLSPS